MSLFPRQQKITGRDLDLFSSLIVLLTVLALTIGESKIYNLLRLQLALDSVKMTLVLSVLMLLPRQQLAECHSVVVQQRASSRATTQVLLVTSNQDFLVRVLTIPFLSTKDLGGLILMVRLASRLGFTTRQMVDMTSIHRDSVVVLSLDLLKVQSLLLFSMKLMDSSVLRVLLPSRQYEVKLVLVKKTFLYRVEHSIRLSSIRLIESSPSTMKRLTEEHLHTIYLLLSMLSLLIMDISLIQLPSLRTMVM